MTFCVSWTRRIYIYQFGRTKVNAKTDKRKEVFNYKSDPSNFSQKAPSDKTPALTKRLNIDISVVGLLNQLFIIYYCYH